MKIAVLKLLTNEKFNFRDVEKFRGFMGNFFKDEVLFHNHLSKYEFLYKSSKIQYKLIEGSLSIVGINEGAELLEEKKDFLKLLQIGEKIVKVIKQEFELKEFQLEFLDEMREYEFTSEWFALNSENYEKYKNGELDLNRQLQNNIIEFFKMVGVWADKPIQVEGNFNQCLSISKGVKIITFTGNFSTNITLPNWIGLGKRKSIGYGTVVLK